MIRMFVRHNVKSYSAWRKAYNAFDKERQGMGVTAHAVYNTEGFPNDVTITHDFKNMAAAQKFAASPRLKAVMAKAGVASPPQMWFTSPS